MSEVNTPRRSARPPATDDVWNRRLVVAALVVLVLVLAAVIYVVYTGVAVSRAPRTYLENQLTALQRSFDASPTDAQVAALYARTLIEAERYAQARSVIDTFKSNENAGAAVVTVEEARLSWATNHADEALELLESAVKQAEDERQAQIKALTAKGISVEVESDVLPEAYLLMATILDDLDRVDEAIAALDSALAENPTMADVLVARGDLLLRQGDSAAAAADYEKALTMIPGYEPALEGLERAEGGGGDE